jgi:glycosyltransferase involved in cell wall biosynthesis
MRILILANAVSVHTRRWAEYFRDSGHQVLIASFDDSNYDNIVVHTLPTLGLGKFGRFFSIPVIRSIYHQFQPDIVHAHYVKSYGFLAAAAGVKPLVITAWGSDVLIAPQRSKLIKFLVRFALKKADYVTTVADHLTQAITDLKITPFNISTFPFGVDLELFKINPGKKSNQFMRLICTRNFAPVYDIPTLIKSLLILKHSNVKVETVLTGDGPQRNELESLVQELGLQSDITFLGHVQQTKLAELLAQADIFVSPALSDGNNISLNEAMACGCFPIATNIPANQQWITQGVNGYLYPPGNEQELAQMIGLAIANQDLLRSSRLLNQEIVKERANWKNCVQRMEEIFLSLMEQRGQ